MFGSAAGPGSTGTGALPPIPPPGAIRLPGGTFVNPDPIQDWGRQDQSTGVRPVSQPQQEVPSDRR